MKKVTLFGGTFDPPHNGHIHMMLLLQELFGFDGIYIIPTNKNPLKDTKTPAEYRLEMCQRAFSPFPWCTLLDAEVRRGGVSYTIDTVDYLLEKDPEFKKAEKFFLLGEEAAYSVDQWKEVDRLISMVQPIVISRENFDAGRARSMPLHIFESIQKGWRKATPLGLSSTEIRVRCAKNLYIEHLVPSAVFSYIKNKHLYIKE